jgi:hypothetical protein
MSFKKLLTAAMTVSLIVWIAHPSDAAIQHVSTEGNDANDGLSWATAKQTIQAGVDAAGANGEVLVSNGTYVLTGQVVVSNAITIRGVNGYEHTIVDGNGDATSTRVFYLGEACSLQGLTIRNGCATDADGGGVYCVSPTASIADCVIVGNRARDGGGVYQGVLVNCIISSNRAVNAAGAYASILDNCQIDNNNAETFGGGLRDCTARNCTILKNNAWNGGGVCSGMLYFCTISENEAAWDGGGARDAIMKRCTISKNNVDQNGGGVAGGVLTQCTITENTASKGGGAYVAELYSCAIAKNTARGSSGGGVYNSILNDCVLEQNQAKQYGGGVHGGNVDRCRIWRNTAMRGGGVHSGIINNSLISGNTATNDGGASQSTLNNCTIVHNMRAQNNIGGASGSALNNCIVYYNFGINVATNCVTRYTCAPDAPAGNGNITTVPMFANAGIGDYQLTMGSPCINAGNNNLLPADAASGDFAWRRRICGGRVDMGFLEYIMGPLLSINSLPGDKVRIKRKELVTVTATMTNLPNAYIGIPVDWWLAAYVQNGGLWFYFDPGMNLIPFDINRADCRPVYQGPLAEVPKQTLVRNIRLAPGVYQVWFAVDYPMDGALNLTPGYHLLDCVTLTVE